MLILNKTIIIQSEVNFNFILKGCIFWKFCVENYNPKLLRGHKSQNKMLVTKTDLSVRKTGNKKPLLETSTVSMKALKESVQKGRDKMENILNERKNEKLRLYHDLFYSRHF
jgi:hypothetical protein